MPRNRTDIEPCPSYVQEFNSIWRTWLNTVFEKIGSGPVLIKSYTVTSSPSASESGDDNTFSSLIYITDEVGGPTLAFSDGTNWLRVQDRAIIS